MGWQRQPFWREPRLLVVQPGPAPKRGRGIEVGFRPSQAKLFLLEVVSGKVQERLVGDQFSDGDLWYRSFVKHLQ
jgi:hypothetical protein